MLYTDKVGGDVALVSLPLTLNIFDTFFSVSIVYFEQRNVSWVKPIKSVKPVLTSNITAPKSTSIVSCVLVNRNSWLPLLEWEILNSKIIE